VTPVTLDSASVPATVTYDTVSRVARLVPSANLVQDARYRMTVTGGASAIRDLANNALTTSTVDFTTGPRPTLTTKTPGVNAVGASRTANITATVSETVTGVSATSFTLKNATTGAAVGATSVSFNGTTRVITFDPNVTLAANTRYTVTPTTAIKDLGGNALNPAVNNNTWSFTTGA